MVPNYKGQETLINFIREKNYKSLKRLEQMFKYLAFRKYLQEPYIQYFGRLEASQNNIVHFDMKKSISVDGILVEYVGSSCSENVISIKMRVPLIHYSEM